VHTLALPLKMLADDSTAVRAILINGGLSVTTNSRKREQLAEYILKTPVDQYIRCVSHTGWHGSNFVLPDQTIGEVVSDQIISR
jgi:putative DNA primase/helicase